MRRRLAILMLAWLTPAVAAAQDPPAWTFDADANVFAGLNYQRRKFTDFSSWESQNWLMAGAERRGGRDRLRLGAMLSLEPITLRDIGSPQVFQTGETYQNAPLVDYMHPHDLIMALGGAYERRGGPLRLLVAADIVGSPALGPPTFMHRPSAAENPQTPLSHHYLDSTHITHGVVRGGVGRGAWLVEGSWFRGREPDENRLDVDLGALDSYALRLSWTRGAWSAQISGADLRLPERTTPYDARRFTASIARDAANGRGLSWMAAFGQNREVHGQFEAYLLEATLRATERDAFYTRAESVAKDILDAGFHPPGFHRHRVSQVGAFTLGYVRDLLRSGAGAVGLGGDVTAYYVPDNLRESYGAPLSFHVFVRYRLRPADRHHH